MSRESVATCPLAADELPLLALARRLPERSLVELLAASRRRGPVRRAGEHFGRCRHCAPDALTGTASRCRLGARLLIACRTRRAQRRR